MNIVLKKGDTIEIRNSLYVIIDIKEEGFFDGRKKRAIYTCLQVFSDTESLSYINSIVISITENELEKMLERQQYAIIKYNNAQ